jgi:hypothetical protein
MGSDRFFYYDFSSENVIDDWTSHRLNDGVFLYETLYNSTSGNYSVLFFCAPWYRVSEIKVNDIVVPPTEYDYSYVWPNQLRFGIQVSLREGMNKLEFKVNTPGGEPDPSATVALIPILSHVGFSSYEKRFVYESDCDFSMPTDNHSSVDLTEFSEGIGNQRIPGRFGFSLGDGLLDCAMPFLGNIDKMYLCGHPDYHKPFRWNYYSLPAGAPLCGTEPPAVGIEGNTIEVNHLSVTWGMSYGKDAEFRCTYSLASPGIITEDSSGTICLSGLEHAGNYRYCLQPRTGNEYAITPPEQFRPEDLAENWILLFGCTEFPDVPIMVVFQNPPQRIRVTRNPLSNRLSQITFEGCSLIISATPFGIESFQPLQPDDSDFLRRAIDRCRLWSRAFLAYPTNCKEYYKEEDNNITIVQQFSYRRIQDHWETEPLELAPIPPAAALAIGKDKQQYEDFSFPTKYGGFYGTAGNSSSYRLPVPVVYRRFPLRDIANDHVSPLLPAKELKEHLEFVNAFPATMQSYPYAGAIVESYAWLSTLMFFIDPKNAEELRLQILGRLPGVCDRERYYDYPVINHGEFMRNKPGMEELRHIYADPSMKHRKLWNWYKRTEPFTFVSYDICYLNVTLFSSGIIRDGTRPEIENLQIPLIENDWGLGLTLYYLYLCILATGDNRPVRENWELIKSAYSYFEILHDWACMGTGYSDNAISWVEGANYGAFTSFINLAEIVGDQQAVSKGRYLAAKQFALRVAILKSSDEYFPEYFNRPPWYTTKFFHEESHPSRAFQNAPEGTSKHEGIYNLTTEGLYPELFESLRKYESESLAAAMESVRQELEDRPFERLAAGDKAGPWILEQCNSSILIDEALNPESDDQNLNSEIEAAEKRSMLLRDWRGIHIYSRHLPPGYFKAQLLAWQEMKKHPIHLLHWQGVQITRADWCVDHAEIDIKMIGAHGKLLLHANKTPRKISLNSIQLPHAMQNDYELLLDIGESGTIMVIL